MTYSELATLLKTVGLPVAEPGDSGLALPAIAIQPDGMAPQLGFPWLWEEAEIRVLYPLASNNPAQFEACRAATAAVWVALWGTQVQADEDGPIYADTFTDPPSFGYTLNVRFPGNDLCTPTP